MDKTPRDEPITETPASAVEWPAATEDSLFAAPSEVPPPPQPMRPETPETQDPPAPVAEAPRDEEPVAMAAVEPASEPLPDMPAFAEESVPASEPAAVSEPAPEDELFLAEDEPVVSEEEKEPIPAEEPVIAASIAETVDTEIASGEEVPTPSEVAFEGEASELVATVFADSSDKDVNEGEDELEALRQEVKAAASEIRAQIAKLQLGMAGSEISPDVMAQISELEGVATEIEALLNQIGLYATTEYIKSAISQLKNSAEAAIDAADGALEGATAEYKSEASEAAYEKAMDGYWEDYSKRNRELIEAAKQNWDQGYDSWIEGTNARNKIFQDRIDHLLSTEEGRQEFKFRRKEAEKTAALEISRLRTDPQAAEIVEAAATEAVGKTLMKEFYSGATDYEVRKASLQLKQDDKLMPIRKLITQEFATNVAMQKSIMSQINKKLGINETPLKLEEISKYYLQYNDLEEKIKNGEIDPNSLTDEQKRIMDVGNKIENLHMVLMTEHAKSLGTETGKEFFEYLYERHAGKEGITKEQFDSALNHFIEQNPIIGTSSDEVKHYFEQSKDKYLDETVALIAQENKITAAEAKEKVLSGKYDAGYIKGVVDRIVERDFKIFYDDFKIKYNPQTQNYENIELSMSVGLPEVERLKKEAETNPNVAKFSPEAGNFVTQNQSIAPALVGEHNAAVLASKPIVSINGTQIVGVGSTAPEVPAAANSNSPEAAKIREEMKAATDAAMSTGNMDAMRALIGDTGTKLQNSGVTTDAPKPAAPSPAEAKPAQEQAKAAGELASAAGASAAQKVEKPAEEKQAAATPAQPQAVPSKAI